MKFISLEKADGTSTVSLLIRDDGFIEEYSKDENGNIVKKVIEPVKEITEKEIEDSLQTDG